ncbi:MAG: hypothetical protein EA420_03545 [Candidatus Competibacteraceae bacterium]|nr:MAG: hypothetical protein EA420_03545 [Candidatus Competibacteraceae bacterium]
MHIADDPMLALIIRFAAEAQKAEISNAEFLLQQATAIERYTAQFPASERNARAMEWIAMHARQYRRQWQKAVVAQTLSKTRCPDCPLRGEPHSSPCEIHEFWLNLLQHYVADDISAQEYVESALKLLGRYKDRLKIGLARQRLPPETAQLESA